MSDLDRKAGFDPIDLVKWMHVDELQANAWNPNFVATPELKLLEHSLLITGWIQPILATPEGTIIDGFHRWMLSRESKPLKDRYHGMVPVCILDLSRAERIMMTVRINRAKGSHASLKMSALVHELLDEHRLEREEVAIGIGATLAEIDLLHQDGVFTAKRISDWKYSNAWYPVEVKASAPTTDPPSSPK